MFVSKIIALFFFCLLVACGNKAQTQDASQSQQSKESALSLTMERSRCFGPCPIYKLTIQPDKKVIFEGIEFTKVEGIAESSLSDSKIKELIGEIDKVNFFALKDFYTIESGNCPSYLSDGSTVTLSIKLRGKEKTIEHYNHCYEKGSFYEKRIVPQLYDLENKIDEIVETKRWIGEGK